VSPSDHARRPPKVQLSGDKVRRRRGRGGRVSNLQAAGIAAVLIALACYFVFGGNAPWAGSSFVLKAAFSANTELHIPSPVRIAGVQVGEVTSVTPIPGSATAGIVTMQLNHNALPIHADATAAIRSRTFLEGNFYVQLEPGSPTARTLQSGATLPVANTSGPVQLDRILSALNTPARADLQTVLRGLGNTLDTNGGSGETGGQALNNTLKYSVGALEASAIVNQALLGRQPHDLSGLVRNTGQVAAALGSEPDQLSGLVSSFERTLSTFASRQSQLAATIAVLPALLQQTVAADHNLDGSFVPLQRFATDLIPGIRQLAPTITVALPWLTQLTDLSGGKELGGLLKYLSPAVAHTTASVKPTEALLEGLDDLARCTTNDLVPTGNETIVDPPQGSSGQVYQELLQSFVGVAAASGNFDGNGRYVRASTAGGGTLVQTKPLGSNGPLFGNAVLSPLGVRPIVSGSAPADVSTRACYRNAAPNLNQVSTGTGP
jgi:phospholipid/cholesterol/gamma-HCH transport system substrate-binding protein